MLQKLRSAASFFVFIVIAVLVAACSSAAPAAPTFTPTSVPVMPTTASIPPTRTASGPIAPTSAPTKPTNAPAPTQAADSSPSAQASYDGDWSSTTSSDDMPVLFTIENNQLTSVNVGYAVHFGSCTVSGIRAMTLKRPSTAKYSAFSLPTTMGNNTISAGHSPPTLRQSGH